MNRAHRIKVLVDAGWAPSEVWLQKRLRRGEISGSKVGRQWVMTDEEIEEYLASIKNKPSAPIVEVPRTGLTAASLRRRAS
jgi:hypothetical protein